VSLTAYYPSANGLARAFNKTIEKLLKKFVSKSQRDWDDKLGECLWAYRMTVRTLTKTIPFSLVYGCEVVLSLEIQIIPPSFLDNQDNEQREVSITPPRVESFRRQTSSSPIANRALSSQNFKSFQ